MTSSEQTGIDIKDYLRQEAKAATRSEYYYGRVSAIAGSTNLHRFLAAAANLQLSNLLVKRKCSTFQEAPIETPNSAAVFYADVSVHCDHDLPPQSRTTKSPILVVEVLSQSTRRYDLTTKRNEYFRIPTLRHYLLLDTESISAMLYTREADHTWPKDPIEFTDPKATIPLTALKINLNIKNLYRQTGLLI